MKRPFRRSAQHAADPKVAEYEQGAAEMRAEQLSREAAGQPLLAALAGECVDRYLDGINYLRGGNRRRG
ncbi:hypothetical protein [Streptomyces hirsutus]|uniref:hypothetical protein n=1 Tax=Streptomyces hirsutus TaxID=35620 RepID=UPI003318AEAC